MQAATKARLYTAAMRLYSQHDREITISRLASEANLARPTIYAHFPDPTKILGTIARDISDEMHARVEQVTRDLEDPAERLAQGIGHFIRRAHDEPDWGRFLVSNALSEEALQTMMTGAPMHDIQQGLDQGRYSFDPAQIGIATASVAGACLSTMLLVLEGHATWRDASANGIEFILCMLGLDRDEARAIATRPLPELPPRPAR